MNDDMIAGTIVGFVVCLLIAGICGTWPPMVRDRTLHRACGECDHVGECGDYECRPGVDGWQLKAGAR